MKASFLGDTTFFVSRVTTATDQTSLEYGGLLSRVSAYTLCNFVMFMSLTAVTPLLCYNLAMKQIQVIKNIDRRQYSLTVPVLMQLVLSRTLKAKGPVR